RSRGVGALYVLLFFFSSRRRHTRFSRDWSSDVCSSDLKDLGDDQCPEPQTPPEGFVSLFDGETLDGWTMAGPGGFEINECGLLRSEERRVGKECRSRRSQDH